MPSRYHLLTTVEDVNEALETELLHSKLLNDYIGWVRPNMNWRMDPSVWVLDEKDSAWHKRDKWKYQFAVIVEE